MVLEKNSMYWRKKIEDEFYRYDKVLPCFDWETNYVIISHSTLPGKFYVHLVVNDNNELMFTNKIYLTKQASNNAKFNKNIAKVVSISINMWNKHVSYILVKANISPDGLVAKSYLGCSENEMLSLVGKENDCLYTQITPLVKFEICSEHTNRTVPEEKFPSHRECSCEIDHGLADPNTTVPEDKSHLHSGCEIFYGLSYENNYKIFKAMKYPFNEPFYIIFNSKYAKSKLYARLQDTVTDLEPGEYIAKIRLPNVNPDTHIILYSTDFPDETFSHHVCQTSSDALTMKNNILDLNPSGWCISLSLADIRIVLNQDDIINYNPKIKNVVYSFSANAPDLSKSTFCARTKVKSHTSITTPTETPFFTEVKELLKINNNNETPHNILKKELADRKNWIYPVNIDGIEGTPFYKKALITEESSCWVTTANELGFHAIIRNNNIFVFLKKCTKTDHFK